MAGRPRLVWLILVAAIASANRASAAAESCTLQQVGELPVTMDGLRPLVDVRINGIAVRLIADSGAEHNLVDEHEVDRLKLKSNPLGVPDGRFAAEMLVRGANGEINAHSVVAEDFTIPGQAFKDIPFLAAPNNYSSTAIGLLGGGFLNAGKTEFDLADGAIRFWKSEECGAADLAYWAKTKPFSVIRLDPVDDRDREIRGHVSVNGVELSAIFDTGATRSVLGLQAAARAGISRDDPRLQPGGVSGGVGRQLRQTWIAPVASFRIGDEEIRNTRLRVGELDIHDADMLIGADFFLSHRILVSNSQQRLYLTYNGGPVFDLDAAPDEAAPAAPAAEPISADGFIRRAEAAAARREYAQAIADYTKAAKLRPGDSGVLLARERVYAADHQPQPALADLDQALRLKPDDTGILMTRGALQLQQNRPDLAKADFDAATRRDHRLLTYVGTAYANAGLYAQAIAAYDTWLSVPRKDTDAAAALNNRCWARALWNRELDLALADCDASLKAEPRNLNYRNSRGLVLMRLGRFDEAVREYDAILHEQPKAAWPLYCRGLTKLKAGRAAEGHADISAAVAIDPGVTARAIKDGLVDAAASAAGASAAR